MNSTPDTRHSLILRLTDRNDQQAWSEFLEIYEPLIQRLVKRRGLQDADAQEVTQEVLLKVAQAVGRWTPSGRSGSFRAWLFQIARNTLINHLAGRQRRATYTDDSLVREIADEESDEFGQLTAEFDLEFKRRVFHWAAHKVRPLVQEETWQAFWRTAVEHHDVKLVAAELGTSPGNIYVSRSRVMRRLREEIKRLDEKETGDGCSHESM